MSRPTERLIAVDGVNGAAVAAAARALVAQARQRRTTFSRWDASGILGEVAVAAVGAGIPSARTLMLLYAADLAFRLRWEIRPALAAGRHVVAAPYVDTALAFGAAAGIDAAWLVDLFVFAPPAGTRRFVHAAAAHTVAERKGFVEFGCHQVLGHHAGAARLDLVKRIAARLKALSRREPARSTIPTATRRPGS